MRHDYTDTFICHCAHGVHYATLEDYSTNGERPNSFVGCGATENEAKDDLNTQLSEYAAEDQAERGEFLQEQQRDMEQGL